ncbi:MAG: hypothetical protein M3Y08_08230 [Fibrobacterota bacterium]|nr:hypothetical protein [Fibrobacterota bacterium]
MRIPSARSLLPLLLAGLAGCVFESDPKVAGGAQDFPNTVSLGMAASSHISEHTEWNQFSAIPSTLSVGGSDSIFVPPESLYQAKPKVSAGLAKGSAAALFDTVFLDLSDTATLKVARRIHQQETALKFKGDTVTIRYDDKAVDTVNGNELILESKGAELWKASERRSAYRYENTDSAGGFDRATFLDRTPTLFPAGFKFRLLVLLPGPDGDILSKADNRPAYYAFARVRLDAGAVVDTLESFDITDADGDGSLWGAGDSGVVNFRQKLPTPPFRPLVVSVAQKMRAVLFKDEQKTYPLSFKETRVEQDGRKVVFSVHGARGGIDSTFNPGDTVVITQHIIFPPAAKMVEKTTKYKVILSAVPKRYSEAKLIRYSLEAIWGEDSLSSTKFTFIPDSLVPTKELSITGALVFEYDFANGRSGTAKGRFENKVIGVELTESDAKGVARRFRIEWDALGKLIKRTVLK